MNKEHKKPNTPVEKSIGKIAEEYGVSYSLVHVLDARIRRDYDTPADKKKGLYQKYHITKTDGTKVDPLAEYFVLRIDTDYHARVALKAYAISITISTKGEDKQLAREIDAWLVGRDPDTLDEPKTDMGKWLYRFYHAWQLSSEGVLDEEAEESYGEICKRLERTIPDTPTDADVIRKEHPLEAYASQLKPSPSAPADVDVDDIVRMVMDRAAKHYAEENWITEYDNVRKDIKQILQGANARLTDDELINRLGFEKAEEPTEDGEVEDE